MANIVTDQNFEEVVLKSTLPVLVDFFAPWCGPCQMLMPTIEQLASEYDGKVLIVKLNVDESMATAQKYGVMSIPTLAFFKGGQEVDRINGAVPRDMLVQKLDTL